MALHSHCFASAAAAELFTTAGDATLTLKSIASSQHYTFRVAQAPARAEGESKPRLWWVSVRAGAESEDFVYVGTMRQRSDGEYNFGLTKKSRFTIGAPSVKAFEYFTAHVLNRNTIPNALEVWHEGKCGMCNRPLTHPDSIALGIGPICAERMGIALPAAAA